MRKRTSLRGLGADAFFPPPAPQQDRQPANQQASTPASDQADKTASEQASRHDEQFIKATFYLTPAQVLKLERIRLERHKKGERTDKSALVREAIDRLEE